MITPSHKSAKRLAQRGFTLVEMIAVIVLVGIISGVVALFIRLPISSYVDSVARADITDTGDTALRRIARDVRAALPNSVRVTTNGSDQYLEMLETRTGGRYLDASDNPTSGNILSFTNAAATSFDIVGPAPTGPQTIQVGDSVVVYNLGPGITPADAYASAPTLNNRASITSVTSSGGVTTIGMASNPFASESPSLPSPYHRFQIVIGPVTYYWNSSARTLTRYWNYTISETQPNSIAALASGSSALIATGVSNCAFIYNASSQTNALFEATMQLTAPSTDVSQNSGSIGLFQQVHVDNTP